MPDDETPWWMNHQNLERMARQIDEEGGDIPEILYMLEKPWKYDVEWAKIQSGRDGEDAALTDLRETRTL